MTAENTVVVAVDGSDAAKNAVRWAANTASKRGVPLRIASSYTMPQFLYAEGMVPPQELFDELQAETMSIVEEAKKSLKKSTLTSKSPTPLPKAPPSTCCWSSAKPTK